MRFGRPGPIAIHALILCAAGAASAQVRPIDFKSREAAEGRNYAERITASLAVGKSSGQASYAYGFGLPAGRGVSPALALSYSSGGSVSEVGTGWALTIPMIERSSKHGVPTFTGADTFQYRDGHSATELIATGELTSDGWTVYREESERSFARYLRKNNTWRILFKEGTRYELGTLVGSRRGPNRSIDSGTAAWMLARIADTHGNVASYTYADGSGQQSLLRSIAYTSNPGIGLAPTYVVTLQWEPLFGVANETMTSFRRGYKESFGVERLASVTIAAPAIDTANSPAKVPASSPTSITHTITHEAVTSEGITTYRVSRIQPADRPELVFAYSDPWWSPSEFEPAEIKYAFPQAPSDVMADSLGRTETEIEPYPRTWSRVAMADVTGDGRPDLIDAKTECSNERWIVWRNTASGFEAERWAAPAVPDGERRDRCALRVTEAYDDVTNITWQELVDFTGDSLPDLAYWDAAKMWLCPGNGHGFDPCVFWGALPAGVTPGVFRREFTAFENISATDVDLMDFNADGFVDRVSTSVGSSPPTIHVVYNDRGQGWGELREYALPHCSAVPGFISCLRLTERIVAGDANRILWNDIRDINGDGLPDFLRTDPRGGGIAVSWGTGGDYGPTRWLPGAPPAVGFGHESSGGDYHALLDLIDLNGDGLLDVMEHGLDGQLTVRFGYGGGWDFVEHFYALGPNPPAASYASPSLSAQVRVSAEEIDTRGMVVDIDGDGIADFVTSPLTSQVGAGSVLVRSLSYRAPRYLLRASSLGGNVLNEIQYQPLPGALPFAIHVPRTHTVRRAPLHAGEPTSQTESTVGYEYADAVYDPFDREFRGFTTVIATPVDRGAQVTTNYLTGKYSAGVVETEVVANLTGGSRPRTIISEYTESMLSVGSVFVRLDRRRVLDGAFAQWRVEETEYGDYFYGMPRAVIEKGDSGTWSDDITTATSFVVRRDSDHLLVLPSTLTRSRSGAIAARTQHYYDNRSTLGTTPTKGNLLRTRRQRELFLWVDDQAFYDDETGSGVGVMVTYRDPEGTETQYAYDPTYRSFPVRETNPVGVVHRSFHALSQTIADVCGPQYLGSTWRCARTEVDVLGRPIAVHVPIIRNGAFELGRTDVIAYDDFTYPLRSERTTRPSARDAARFIRYVDGLGGVAQTRIEETSGTFRVLDHGNDASGNNVWTSQLRRESGTAYSSQGDPGRFGYRYTYDYVRGAVETTAFPRDTSDPRPQATTSTIHFGTHVVSWDEAGRTTTTLLDSFGRVSELHRDGAALGVARTTYGYDANHLLSSITDPNGLVTGYQRNMLGWTTVAVMPDGVRHELIHNQRGQVVTRTDPRGSTVRTIYDQAGRPRREYSTTTLSGIRGIDETVRYYNASSSTAQIGWVREREADGVVQAFTYDAGGRPVRREGRYQGWVYGIDASWTSDGRLANVRFPDGWYVKYAYYLDGTTRSVWDADTGYVLGEALLADNGRPSVVTSDLGLEESFDYDARDRVTRIMSSNTVASALPLVDDTLGWEDTSELASIHRRGLLPGMQPRAFPDVFKVIHDSLGHLKRVTKNGDKYAQYTHDLGGRLVAFNELGDAYSYQYSFDKMEARTSPAMSHSYKYDAAGNVRSSVLVGAPGAGYSGHLAWDASGRISDVTIERPLGDVDATSYHYLGGELSRVVGPGVPPFETTEMLHVGDWLRVDLANEDSTNRVFLGPRLLLERRAGSIEYIHRTLGGSTAAVSTSTGSVLSQEEFLPYGQSEIRSGGSAHETGFHGLRRDELIVAGPRAYDAAAGRWLARDPMMLDADGFASMLDLDGYSYAYGRPFSFRDPSGLEPDWLDYFSLATGPTAVWSLIDTVRDLGAGDADPVDVVAGGVPGRAGDAASVGVAAYHAYNGEYTIAGIWLGAALIPGNGDKVAREQAVEVVENAAKKEAAQRTHPEGSFSIFDWSGYPAGAPKPTGPFRLLQGAEYEAARDAADKANKALHAANPALRGLDIHEIHPVKFGGSPTDVANKVALPRAQHAPITRWWNQLQRTLANTP
ncbi:MAG: hypothetical protein F9K40_01875 [Kofleriaceae bacterium]|nr:MAG: hypothetical protein F9K40_01875 [Kofleriaceae bacterium]